MNTLEALGSIAAVVNAIIDLLDSNEKQVRARRMFIDSLEELRKAIREEKDAQTLDRLIRELIARVHSR